MVQKLAEMLGVSDTTVIPILIFAAVQLAAQLYSLVDLARRDVVLGGRRWVWALVIIFGNLVGAIIYLAVGRRAVVPASTPGGQGGGGEAAMRAVDTLYGQHDRT